MDYYYQQNRKNVSANCRLKPLNIERNQMINKNDEETQGQYSF